MPGIVALRKRASEDKPLAGAKIAVCVHVTTQVAVSGHLVVYAMRELLTRHCL